MNRCADGRRPKLCGGGAVHAIDPYALMVSCTWEGAPNSDYTWRTPVQSCATSREACFKNDAVYKALRYKNRDGVWNISRSAKCRHARSQHTVPACLPFVACPPVQAGHHLMPRVILPWHVYTSRHLSVYDILSLHGLSPCMDRWSSHDACFSHDKASRHVTRDRFLSRRPVLRYPHFLVCHPDMRCHQFMTSRPRMYH